MSAERPAASVPSRIMDAICALGVLSMIFWPLLVFALGVWFLLWVLRCIVIVVQTVAGVAEYVTRA